MTMSCPEPPIQRGRYQGSSRVESCDEHAEELLDVGRIRGR